jgi:hypothetical protein
MSTVVLLGVYYRTSIPKKRQEDFEGRTHKESLYLSEIKARGMLKPGEIEMEVDQGPRERNPELPMPKDL